ncbi:MULTISPECIES: hypothetical protein [Rhizobium]|uniref:DUF2384 domain-containing protein n=1 Tax=Rhizobium paranaense TaxID=1650438 RepID=A0A7W9D508_9HYPH|nr:hypothetical protein [Rhizobium paranaense]MBB5578042.1 hypothetical protein [Rhizobium paranaense]
MATSDGLRVYDGAEFAHALQTEMGSVADKKGSVADKTVVSRKSGFHISAFTSKLRKAMANAMHAKPGAGIDDMMVVLVETPNRAVRDTIRDIVEHVPAIVEARQSKLTDEAIDALVSVYMRAPPSAEAERLLYDSNAKARARFLENWPSFTSKELADIAGHGSKNKSMTASRWKTKGKVFSVKHGGSEYFPAFQFDDGQPIETIGQVLTRLGEKKSGWQLAFWFTSPNGWLDGKRPVDVLANGNAVTQAAAREAEDIIG